MTHLSQKIGLRPAVPGDLPFLHELRRTTLSAVVTNHHEWDDAKQQARVRMHFESAKIIMVDGEAVGLLKAYCDSHSFHLSQIQVLPDYQGRGIGTQLIEDLQQQAQQLQVSITLHVYRSNPAIRLYQRRGFHVVAETNDMFTMTWKPQCKRSQL